MPTPIAEEPAIDLRGLSVGPCADGLAAPAIARDQLPHMIRYVLDRNGGRFVANSNVQLGETLDDISGPKTVVYALLHREPAGADRREEITAKFTVE